MFNFHKKEDIQIQDDVINELRWDQSINSDELTATSNEGIVTLRGSVPHFSEKEKAESAAQRVGGVRAVANEIEVKMLGQFEREDDDIAEAILTAFKWNYSVPKEIKVSVEKGWVTLKGEVEWDYQRNAAKDSVTQLLGVAGVTNSISIKTKPQPSDIKFRIEEALKRSAENESRKISVAVDGKKVILSGEVQSISEVGDAGIAAWNAPGITNVENNLKITTS